MCEEISRPPKIAVSFDMKVNMGNYESAGGSCMLSGIDVDAKPKDIIKMLDTAEIAFGLVRERLECEIAEYKAERRR